jgi:Uma2 family endonuclease
VFVQLARDQFLAADIAWWSASRRPPFQEGAIDVVTDLVDEVLSAATRANDLGIKRDRYLEVRVQELWLADPSEKTLIRARPSTGDERLSSADTLGSELLNGLSVALARIFFEA